MTKVQKMGGDILRDLEVESDNGAPNWKRNLAVCIFGSFTNIISLTLVIPFLPIYVEQLGVQGQASIATWSGVCFAAAFFTAGIVAPMWGKLSDRYGRKIMLMRASLGMAIGMSLMGLVGSIWQLFGLRLFVGLLGGYASAAMILVATQAPKARSGWALGLLSSGVMAGNLVGPLIGGVLPQRIGIRETFWLVGGIVFVGFLATVFLIHEDLRLPSRKSAPLSGQPSASNRLTVLLMLGLGLLTLLANVSIVPIITIFLERFVEDPRQVTFVAGLVISATALGSSISAALLGRLADDISHWIVIAAGMAVAALLTVPQAYVTEAWQLIGLRFAMGLALGGLLPCIASILRHNAHDRSAGSVLGYLVSAQFAGQVAGPLFGGLVGGLLSTRAVFLGTAALLAFGAGCTWMIAPKPIWRMHG